MNARIELQSKPSMNVGIVSLLLYRRLTTCANDPQDRLGDVWPYAVQEGVRGWGIAAEILGGNSNQLHIQSGDRAVIPSKATQRIIPTCFEMALKTEIPPTRPLVELVRPVWRDICRTSSASIRQLNYIISVNGASHAFEVMRVAYSYTLLSKSAIDLFMIDNVVPKGAESIRIIPSALWLFEPVLIFSQRGRQICVIYPAGRPLCNSEPAKHHSHALEQLIGATRAAVLDSLTSPINTTDLARKLSVSVPAASRHTTVLRRAGLISSIRRGQSLQHYPTSLGINLVHATEWVDPNHICRSTHRAKMISLFTRFGR